MNNCYLIIIDGLGVGAQEDAHLYGDENMNTMGHVSEETGVKLPHFEQLGLGNIIDLASVHRVENPMAAFGKMRELSAGKDSTTGHWEIAGIHLDKPFPTYPNGFPEEVIEAFNKAVGVEVSLCNKPYSGTHVIRDFGEEHLKTGNPIVYTSSDSVFQIACHDEIVSVQKLHEWCSIAREEILVGDHLVGRVIARPFTGNHPFERLNNDRKDFSAVPPKENIVQILQVAGVKTYSIGKVIDLFAGLGFTQYRKTKSNAEGISQILSIMSAVKDSFIFVNLIDTDQLYGHRLDPEGYAESLMEFDRALPAILNKMDDSDMLIITGDHGNDPVSTSTDHSREFVPLIVYPGTITNQIDLGTRDTFADIAKSVGEFFGIGNNLPGKSFIK